MKFILCHHLTLLLWLVSIVVHVSVTSARYDGISQATHHRSLGPEKSQSLFHQRTSRPIIAAVAVPPVLQNLARGSVLKCLADLTGGLPLEVWKSSVVLESIQRKNNDSTNSPPRSSITILKSIISDQGLPTLWSGLTPRMIEGIFSGGVLLASKELIHTLLSDYVSPIALKRVGVAIPPAAIGFVSGAGGGMAQALVMGPTSLVVTACVLASKNDDGEPVSAFRVAQDVLRERGIVGLYRGAPAVAFRQATNWASRQGFTEWVRPRIPVEGVAGELLSGCIGGVLSAWNTPFEVARIESQSKIMGRQTAPGLDHR